MELSVDKKLNFTSGDKNEALSIMREAAFWLAGKGEPLWNPEEFTENSFNSPPGNFYVAWQGNESIGAFLLNFDVDFIWQGYTEPSGYVHKLSVRRKFAGKGYSQMLLEYAADICREKSDIEYLRLDCDLHRKKLCSLYENFGFQLVKIKSFNTEKYGKVDCALYQLEI